MTEDEFWSSLEYRICRELRGMDDKVLRRMWCDGIRGHIVRPQTGPTHLSGTIWIGDGGQTEMQLTMALPEDISVDNCVPWSDIFPPENLTAWLSVDAQRKRVAIDLSKAEPIET